MAGEKIYLSADSFLRDCWRLAAQIRHAGWKPDFMLALWRGGAMPGVAVHEFLKMTDWSVRHLPLKCASYTSENQTTGVVDFTLGDETCALLTSGSRVLVVDDVFDSGYTAQAVRARLTACGCEAKIACVYWKVSQNKTTDKPDFYVRDTGDHWIIFPHEIEGLTREERCVKDPFLAEMLSECDKIREDKGNG